MILVAGLKNYEMTQIDYPEILLKFRSSCTPSLSPNIFFSITIYLVQKTYQIMLFLSGLGHLLLGDFLRAIKVILKPDVPYDTVVSRNK